MRDHLPLLIVLGLAALVVLGISFYLVAHL